MQIKQTHYENLIHKKNTLTKCLLFAVLFNVILQFDCVERLFSSHYSQSQHTIMATELCGSGYNIELPKPVHATIELASCPGHLNPNSSPQTLGFIRQNFDTEFYIKTFNLAALDITEVPSYIVYSFPGLSPPLV